MMMDTTYRDRSNDLKGTVFSLFLGFAGAIIWTYARLDAKELPESRAWLIMGSLFAAMIACIGVVAWIEHVGGFAVLSDRTRRGFNVIFRKDTPDE